MLLQSILPFHITSGNIKGLELLILRIVRHLLEKRLMIHGLNKKFRIS